MIIASIFMMTGEERRRLILMNMEEEDLYPPWGNGNSHHWTDENFVLARPNIRLRIKENLTND